MNREQNRALVETTARPEEKTPYFRCVASRYTLAARVLSLVLVLFLVVFTIFFSRAFTYNSLFGFFKDLRALSAFVPKSEADIYATFAPETCAASYRGGVAFADSEGVSAYSPDGKCLFSAKREFASPRIVASRKYFLVFDAGGNTFSICNAYAELYVGKTELPILSAALSDTGHFAIITASDRALSAIDLFDANFDEIARFQRASATLSVAFTENGKKMAILGMKAENGVSGTLLEVFEVGKDTPEFSEFYGGELPLSIAFGDNKNMTLLTEKAMRRYKNGELKNEIGVKGEALAFGANKNGAFLVTRTDDFTAGFRVTMTDKKGEIIYENDAFTGDLLSALRTENTLYLLLDDTILTVSPQKGEIASYPAKDAEALLYADEDGARVFAAASAAYISFTK